MSIPRFYPYAVFTLESYLRTGDEAVLDELLNFMEALDLSAAEVDEMHRRVYGGDAAVE